METLKKTIIIYGHGYVGNAMENLLKKHYHVTISDPKYNEPLKTEIDNYDLAIVCVPTPMKEGTNECDIRIVENVIRDIKSDLILIKSTVEIGTTDRLKKKYKKRIVFSPEYCGESSYWTPHQFHTKIVETPFFIFGGDKEDTSVMVDYFMPVCGPTKRYIQTDAKTAELVKYMENTFYAMKIAYCYEIYEICQKLGIDYNEVRELWVTDPRINSMHTSIFPENIFPFAGKCLPKDLNGLIQLAEKIGYEPKLLKEVWDSNLRIAEIRKKRLQK